MPKVTRYNLKTKSPAQLGALFNDVTTELGTLAAHSLEAADARYVLNAIVRELASRAPSP